MGNKLCYVPLTDASRDYQKVNDVRFDLELNFQNVVLFQVRDELEQLVNDEGDTADLNSSNLVMLDFFHRLAFLKLTTVNAMLMNFPLQLD